MDGAEAFYRYQTLVVNAKLQGVGGRGVDATKCLGVSLHEADPSADLGGSSKYSNENFED